MIFKLFGIMLAAVGALLVLSHSSLIPHDLNPVQQEGFAMKKLGIGLVLVAAGVWLIVYT